MQLTDTLETNLNILTHLTGGSADRIVSRITVCGIACALLSCEGMCSSEGFTERLAAPLSALAGSFGSGDALLRHLQKTQLPSADCTAVCETAELLRLLHAGFVILLADSAAFGLAYGMQGFASRSISEPSGELNLYGAREGFTEPVRTNMALLRRRLKSPLLCFEMHTAGTLSQTELCMVYLRDRVPENLLQSVRQTLQALPLESIFSVGYVRPFLEGSDMQLVHSTGITERPDICCAKLLEGRVGILIDGTPFALLLPQLFCETFQTLDDYNYPPLYATLLRWIKYAAALTALLLPAFYLAAALHHPELLHETLLRLLADSEQNVPFSLAAEMLGVLLLFEIVREAGLRLPKAVGGAVGMIGGLLIGDAAVQSGLISTPVLTAAALSATAGFIIPEHHAALTVLRPAFILAAAAAGLPGIALAGTALLMHICSTEIFGYPVSAPVAPLLPKRLADIAARIGFRRLSQRNFRISEIKPDP